MESLAALGLAANICQFLQFGGKLVHDTSELYNSLDGTTSANRVLETITKDLTNLCVELGKNEGSIDQTSASQSEKSLLALAQECQKKGEDFISLLQEMKVDQSSGKLRSAWRAVRGVSKEREIKQYEQELAAYQSSLATRLLMVLTNLEVAVVNQPEKLRREVVNCLNNFLEPPEKTELNEKKRKVDEQKHKTNGQENKTTDEQKTESDETKNKTGHRDESIQDNGHNDVQQKHDDKAARMYPQLPADLPGRLYDLASQGQLLSKQLKFMETLYFTTIWDRKEGIKEAHSSTFEWLFDDPQCSNDHEVTTILDWLRSQNGIYWVSGKAGSGKSTLMKLFYKHNKTQAALRQWAAGNKLLIASYFFWHAGSPMQKSQQGLLQTLLFHIVKQCPSLIPVISPCRWESEEIGNSWTFKELQQAVTYLQKINIDSARFCFFIDGLDEYDGDHVEIIEVIDQLVSSQAVKVCFASRPWIVFRNRYGENDGLKIELHDLTRGDMECFVTAKLAGFKAAKRDPQMYNDLINEIVENAEGVFLWVFLVVQSLRRGLTNRDTAIELRKRLRTLPKDLETFFRHILDSAEDVYHEQAAKLYLIRICSVGILSALDVSYFDETAPDFALSPVSEKWNKNAIAQKQEDTKIRVLARCTDLLEFNRNGRLQYLHRTVRDFFETRDMQMVLLDRAGKDFSPHRFMCNSKMRQMKLLVSKPLSDERLESFESMLDTFMHHARQLEIQGSQDYKLFSHLETIVISLRSKGSFQLGCTWGTIDLAQGYYRSWLLEIALKNNHARNRKRKSTSRSTRPSPLHIALTSLPPSRLCTDVVKTLLNTSGADPNEPCPGLAHTVWSHYLETLQIRDPAFGDRNFWGTNRVDLITWSAQTIKLLIRSGADISLLLGKKQVDPVVDMLGLRDELAELENEMRVRREEAKGSGLVAGRSEPEVREVVETKERLSEDLVGKTAVRREEKNVESLSKGYKIRAVRFVKIGRLKIVKPWRWE
ncbi:uncharacterized protein KY384_003036 [Bacidia gigantensis]|uniref:uncharacterized protein n=1 Tax=Bacidia gigantensis TaxID=2732470 RepID=UPI001D04E413|nr:uncharacterized protein KY384_003036 [Bacidia gigantensis]KAG8531407.1 hypothetical protein KY384_003036 [Bacidia gigantensis]